MDPLQGTLGQTLLVLIALAVVLFTIILLLVEADYILRLGGKLARRWKSGGLEPGDSDPPAMDDVTTQCRRDERAAQ